MECVHRGKTLKCTYCSEIFRKPLQEFINDHYYARAVGGNGILERFWYLKAWMEQQETFEQSLV